MSKPTLHITSPLASLIEPALGRYWFRVMGKMAGISALQVSQQFSLKKTLILVLQAFWLNHPMRQNQCKSGTKNKGFSRWTPI